MMSKRRRRSTRTPATGRLRRIAMLAVLGIAGCGPLEGPPQAPNGSPGDPGLDIVQSALPLTIDVRLQVILLHDNATETTCGGTACTTAADVTNAVNLANQVFAPANLVIHFSPLFDWTTLVNANLNANLVSGGSASVMTAANNIAAQYPGKIVVFLRKVGPGAFATPPNTGQAVPVDAQFWNPQPNFVGHLGVQSQFQASMANFSHELGHYLGLYHTHLTWENCYPVNSTTCRATYKGDTLANIEAAIKTLQSRSTGLDGDLLSDTPEDPGPDYWTARGLNPCSTPTVTIGTKSYTPSKSNVMSYFNCGGTPTLTTQQANAIRASLGHPSRALLINRPDQVGSITLDVGVFGDWAGSFTMCPMGSYAYGVNLKSEPNQGGSADDTALNGISLHCYDTASSLFTGYAVSTEGPWGTWQANTYCGVPNNPIVAGDLQVEANQGGSADDTGANDLKIACEGAPTTEITVASLTHWGTFRGLKTCPPLSAVCGIRTRVEANQGGNADDTALNGAQFACCSFF